jgi:hypothetical protein
VNSGDDAKGGSIGHRVQRPLLLELKATVLATFVRIKEISVDVATVIAQTGVKANPNDHQENKWCDDQSQPPEGRNQQKGEQPARAHRRALKEFSSLVNGQPGTEEVFVEKLENDKSPKKGDKQQTTDLITDQ